ncbi:hypothetical protein GN956_G16930 [Arapaima gigas]
MKHLTAGVFALVLLTLANAQTISTTTMATTNTTTTTTTGNSNTSTIKTNINNNPQLSSNDDWNDIHSANHLWRLKQDQRHRQGDHGNWQRHLDPQDFCRSSAAVCTASRTVLPVALTAVLGKQPNNKHANLGSR